jgi:hypothetical protein
MKTVISASIFVCCAASLATGGEKEIAVKAQILVVKRDAGHGSAAVSEDFVSTNVMLAKSGVIVERAVKKANLQSLKSLTGVRDPVAAIQAALTVTRDPGDSHSITLEYRGTSLEDGVKVLEAIISSHKDFLDETYQNVDDATVELIVKARDTLAKKLSEAEQQYRKFREKGAAEKIDSATLDKRIAKLEQATTDFVIRRTEIAAALKIAEGDPTRLSVQLEAQEWATRIGFDKLPKTIQEVGPVAAYRAHLKGKLESLDAAAAGLTEQLQSERARARAESELKLEDSRFRTDVSRLQQVYDATVKRLEEIRLTRESGRLTIHVLSAPKATKS